MNWKFWKKAEKLDTVDPHEMDINEFFKKGFLQEANRLFFHPLGLALSVDVDEETGRAVGFGPIWDYREDPEGIAFIEGQISRNKVRTVKKLKKSKLKVRNELFGVEDGIQVK